MRTNLRTRAISLAALGAAGVPAMALTGPAAGPSSTPETIGDWTVLQRPLGCEIIDAANAPSLGPTFYRPFRGSALMHVAASAGVAEFQPLSALTKSPGWLRIEGGQLPVEGSLLIALDAKRLTVKQPPTVVVTFTGSEQAFRNAIKTASAAQLEFGGRITGKVSLAGAAEAWERADRCLARVGEALLAARPRSKKGPEPTTRRPTPRGSASTWIDPDTYPQEAVRAKAEGDVRVAVSVDRYGYPLDCRVAQSAGFKALDDVTCERILKRGHFYPARDEAGVPVDGTWEITVRWNI